MTTITPGLFKLGLRDVIQGAIMAGGGAAFGVISGSLNAGDFTFNWTAIWHAAMVATVVYLGKRFFTPAQIIKPVEPKQ